MKKKTKKDTPWRKRVPVKGVFALGIAALTGKVYAGLIRGNQFVGKKRDVTSSFLNTVVARLTEENGTKMFARTISDGERTWEISIRLLPKEADDSAAFPHVSINGAVAQMATR